MATISAAEKAAGHGEKEKVEKRRALGRGLESLFRGPRVVARPVSPPAVDESLGAPAHGGEHLQLSPAPGQGVSQLPRDIGHAASTVPAGTADGGNKTQIPHLVRDDDMAAGEGTTAPVVIPEIRVVVETNDRGTGVSAPHDAPAGTAAETQIPQFVRDDNALRDHTALGDDSTIGNDIAAHAVMPHETISIQASAEERAPSNLVVPLPLDRIDKNPYQTRYDFNDDALQELADSIRVQGVVQPIVVRPGEDGRYLLILGERRCRASKMAGKTTIPAIVKRVSTQQAAEMTIIENLQRQDLNPLEQAEAFRVLSRDFNMTQQQIGERVGMSRESVSNYMRLLKLTQPVMEHVLAGRIRFSEARELLKLEDPAKIELAAERVVKEEMKWEQIETMVARMTGWLDPVPGLPGEERKRKGAARWVDPNVRAAQMELEQLLQVRVRIKDRKGKGKIIIEYSTVDDYERVVEMLRGKE